MGFSVFIYLALSHSIVGYVQHQCRVAGLLSIYIFIHLSVWVDSTVVFGFLEGPSPATLVNLNSIQKAQSPFIHLFIILI